MRILSLILMVVSSLILCSCNSDDELWLSERDEIRTYLTTNGIQDYIEDSQAGYFYYFIDVVDTSQSIPTINSTIVVDAVGRLLGGSVFYSTIDNGAAEVIALEDAIYGWQLAFQQLHKGSKLVLILPSRLGYGTSGLAPDVPANSILLFEIDFLDFY